MEFLLYISDLYSLPPGFLSCSTRSASSSLLAAESVTLRGSLLAVLTPIFAGKSLLESSWRDLQDLHTFAPLKPLNVSKNSPDFCYFKNKLFKTSIPINMFPIVCAMLMKFCRNFATIFKKKKNHGHLQNIFSRFANISWKFRNQINSIINLFINLISFNYSFHSPSYLD